MAIEITDIIAEGEGEAPQRSVSASSPSAPPEERPETLQQSPPVAPRGRGRPQGSKDKQPRKRQASFARGQRPVRAASPDDLEKEEEEEPQPARPLTRRSTARPKPARRRVQVVEESEEEEAETPPPSPRTRRHQEWTAYRQQKATAHQANVNHYAILFDRMLA